MIERETDGITSVMGANVQLGRRACGEGGTAVVGPKSVEFDEETDVDRTGSALEGLETAEVQRHDGRDIGVPSLIVPVSDRRC